MEGMICTQVVETQHTYQKLCGTKCTLKSWATLVIKLMEITHGQCIYCNVVVHDTVLGALGTKTKVETQQEIEKQQLLGLKDLQEEDQYLTEVNSEDLEVTLGERQQYWLIAIQAARKAKQLAQESANKEITDSGDIKVGNEDGHLNKLQTPVKQAKLTGLSVAYFTQERNALWKKSSTLSGPVLPCCLVLLRRLKTLMWLNWSR
jgi:hypothetical protein